MKNILLISTFFWVFQFISAQTIIPAGSSWKYLDDGSNQETAWQSLSYNDNAWETGNAQLGYGDGDETTVISYGSSPSHKHICYYFRKTFNVSDPNLNSGVRISLLHDDGAVIYINGTEIIRANMPLGNIEYHTRANIEVSGSAEGFFDQYSFPSSILNAGQNIIAVEIHQISPSSSDVSFDLKLEFEVFDYYKKYPYVLYTGNNDEMMVIWQLNVTESCEFSFGTDTTYSNGTFFTNEYGDAHQHKIVLSGLIPGQKYYYKVKVANTFEREGSFNAGPLDTTQNTTFFAYGDTRSNPDMHNIVAGRILQDIVQNNLDQSFIINSGDMVTTGNSEGAWDTEFFNKQYTHIIDMLGNLSYFPTFGNHEGQGILLNKYFPLPMFTNNVYYYAFDYGPAHIIVINQEVDYSQGSTQYNRIVNDLSSSDKPWKIAVFHKPGWSAGGHPNSTMVQNTLQPLFEQYNVAIVINGHNHYYSRAVVNGVQHITTGGGGVAPLDHPDSSFPNIVTVDRSHHYCKIEIAGDTLHFYANRSNGTQIENFTLTTSINGIQDDIKNDWFAYSKNGRIIIKITNIQSVNVEIYDTFGKRISSQKNINSRAVFNVNKTGVYFIRLIKNGNFSVKKIIVDK